MAQVARDEYRMSTKLFFCQDCQEPPPKTKSNIYECANGHLFCYRCRCVNKNKPCPQCQSNLFYEKHFRRLVVNAVLESVDIPRTTFETSSSFRSVNLCPDLGFSKCPIVVSTGDMLREHLKTAHSGIDFGANKFWAFNDIWSTQYAEAAGCVVKNKIHELVWSPTSFNAMFISDRKFSRKGKVVSISYDTFDLGFGVVSQKASNYPVTITVSLRNNDENKLGSRRSVSRRSQYLRNAKNNGKCVSWFEASINYVMHLNDDLNPQTDSNFDLIFTFSIKLDRDTTNVPPKRK